MTRDDETKAPSDDDDRALDQRITEYLKWGIPAGTFTCAAAAGYVAGASAVVLVLCGGALITVIALFWASVRTLVGEAPLSGADAYALGAPRAEEEQKRAVLRALKDLEFERSVGKISEEDHEALVAKYRSEAKRLLRVLDEDAQPQRARVEALIERRLQKEGVAAEPEGDDDEVKAEPAAKKSEAKAPEAKAPEAKAPEGKKGKPDKVACIKCGTKNDVDAVFCKKCGARQGPEPEDDEDESDKSEEAAS